MADIHGSSLELDLEVGNTGVLLSRWESHWVKAQEVLGTLQLGQPAFGKQFPK